MDAGVSHYTREALTEPLWKLLDQKPEGHPDQGKERTSIEKAKPAEKEKGLKRPASPARAPRGSAETPLRPRMCIVCNKRHEPRCEIPPGFRQEQKRIRKAEREQTTATAAKKPAPAKNPRKEDGK